MCNDNEASLREARSLFWTLAELTSRNATRGLGARSYLFELNEIAQRGVLLVEAAIDASARNAFR